LAHCREGSLDAHSPHTCIQSIDESRSPGRRVHLSRSLDSRTVYNLDKSGSGRQHSNGRPGATFTRTSLRPGDPQVADYASPRVTMSWPLRSAPPGLFICRTSLEPRRQAGLFLKCPGHLLADSVPGLRAPHTASGDVRSTAPYRIQSAHRSPLSVHAVAPTACHDSYVLDPFIFLISSRLRGPGSDLTISETILSPDTDSACFFRNPLETGDPDSSVLFSRGSTGRGVVHRKTVVTSVYQTPL